MHAVDKREFQYEHKNKINTVSHFFEEEKFREKSRIVRVRIKFAGSPKNLSVKSLRAVFHPRRVLTDLQH